MRGLSVAALFTFGLLATSLVSTPSAFCQGNSTGTITGIVTDTSGAVVPAASVVLKNVGTNVEWQKKSDTAGAYSFLNLPVGEYSLTVTATGFEAATVPALHLEVNATEREDIKLVVGKMTETVTVTATLPMLNTSSASLGQVIGTTEVLDLPLNGRDFQQLQLLTAGTVNATNVQTSAGLNGGASALETDPGILNVRNGSRPGHDLYLIDGSDDSDQNGRGLLWRPSVDEIEEFKDQTSNMSAQFGYGSSVTNVSIKSGTNQLHGVAYDFIRNNSLDSRSFFAPTTEVLKWNQFGANAGGPLVLPRLYNGRNRTFWFFNYEGYRLRQGVASYATVPTTQMRQGDFSQLLPVQLYDPATIVPNPASPGSYISSPFQNNQIPLTRENGATAYFLNPSWIPLPNLPGTANNLQNSYTVPTDYNQATVRIDEYIGPKDSLNGRFSYERESDGSYGAYHSLDPVDPGANPKYPHPYNANLNWVHNFNANDLMVARISYGRANVLFTTPNLGLSQNYDTTLGISVFPPSIGDLFKSYPVMNISGYTGLPQGFLLNYVSNNFEYTANFTMIRGRHTFDFGETFRAWQQNLTTSGQDSGTFDFTGQYTTNPLSPGGTGAGIADYFLGVPFEGARYAPIGWFYERMKNYWSYFNDDWKVTPNLTLNLGIRYEINLPMTEKYGHFASFDPTARSGQGAIVIPDPQAVASPSSVLAVTLSYPTYSQFSVFANQVGISPKYLRQPVYDHFAPRIGLADRISNKTVLHAGYGIFFVQLDGNREAEELGPPFLVRENGILNGSVSPTSNIYDLFPPGSSFSQYATLLVGDPKATDWGYMQEWNASVERELPGAFVAQIGYVGSKGTDLQTIENLNMPPPGPGAIQPRRPYPEFGDINWDQQSASSIYHSLQAKIERRFSNGLSVLASYTYSKCIDDDSTDADGLYDIYNRAFDRGDCDFDIPQRFTMETIYQENWFKTQNQFIRGALGNWQVAPIITLQSGFPYTPYVSTDPSNTGSTSRADVVPGCNSVLSNPTPQEWFNTSCFVTPPALPYRFGDAGRNILRGQGTHNVDLGFYKSFKLGESHRSLQIRFEGFNLFNAHTFGLPNATVGTPGYGQITTASAGRQIQIGGKLYF
jgi:hypothetical protein